MTWSEVFRLPLGESPHPIRNNADDAALDPVMGEQVDLACW
jgi:hypothetical protein